MDLQQSQCQYCEKQAEFEPFDIREGRHVLLCKGHYRQWSGATTNRPTPSPPGMRRLRKNLARADMAVKDEPTDLERYLINEEIEEQLPVAADTLREWSRKLGE